MDNDYHNLGNSLQEIGRFDEAVAAYKKAIELNPNFSWSYHSLGDVLLKLEKCEEAVAAYKKAVELNPDFSWVLSQFGRCFAETSAMGRSCCCLPLRDCTQFGFCLVFLQFR